MIRTSYGVYSWIALLAATIPTLVLLVIMPRRHWRRVVARCGARAYFLLIGSPVRIEGTNTLPASPCVLIANHASYLDGIILTAALPPRFTFLIKYEMANLPFAGYLLRRIGSEFVNRDDGQQRQAVARRLMKAARSGESLAFFPEGTFDAAPGLKRFRPGAFAAAWRAQLPVVPIAIYGSRAKLPADVWLPVPGPLSIRICEAVDPADVDSAAALLAAARDSLLECLGEPDLAALGLSAESERALDGP